MAAGSTRHPEVNVLAGFRQRQLVRKERRWQDYRQRVLKHQAFMAQAFMQQASTQQVSMQQARTKHSRTVASLGRTPEADAPKMSERAKAVVRHTSFEQMPANTRGLGLARLRRPRPPWTWERVLSYSWILGGVSLGIAGRLSAEHTESPHFLAGILLLPVGAIGLVVGVAVMGDRPACRTSAPLASSLVYVIVAAMLASQLDNDGDKRLFGLLPAVIGLVTAVLALNARRFPTDPMTRDPTPARQALVS